MEKFLLMVERLIITKNLAFSPEIYNVDNQTTRILSEAYFRRNYHSTSILLPNGTILVSGGDVWNAEIFYPPYLFTKLGK